MTPWLTATEIAGGTRSRELSAAHTIEAALDRIHRLDPQLNAFLGISENARDEAVPLDEDERIAAFHALQQPMIRHIYGPLLARHDDELSPTLRWAISQGENVSAAGYPRGRGAPVGSLPCICVVLPRL